LFAPGDTVVISGVATAGYNGTFVIAVTGANTFTYTDSTSGLPTDTGGGTAGDRTVTVSVPGSLIGVYTGELVTISGNSDAALNGTFTVSGTSPDPFFTYIAATTNLGNGTGGSVKLALAGPQRSMVSDIVYKFNRAVTLAPNAFTMSVLS